MAPADIALGVTGARKPLHHDQVMTPWSGNRVYTCLKSLDKTFRESLRQKNAVVTFDERIYCEAKCIQWATSPDLDNVIVHLGGFH